MKRSIVLCPRDGLSLKDARSMFVAGGMPSRGLSWLTPTTTAGAARAVAGRALGYETTYGADVERWRRLATDVDVRGPLAVVRALDDAARWQPLWPAPRDAVRKPAVDARGRPCGRLEWLEPRPREDLRARVCAVGATDGVERDALESMLLPRLDEREKPLPALPWWSHDELVAWLRDPRPRNESAAGAVPVMRPDVHVAIDAEKDAAADQHLFSLPTLETLVMKRHGASAFEVGVALTVETRDLAGDLELAGLPWRVGGEGRFAWSETLPDEVLAAPQSLLRAWTDTRFLRLCLVTPARFDAGWRPDWLTPVKGADGARFEGEMPGTKKRVALRAAFVDRPQWMSGWNLALREPKPSHVAVSAGAVYYFEALDGAAFAAGDVEALWLASIQTRGTVEARDGFGLVVPGAWPSRSSNR